MKCFAKKIGRKYAKMLTLMIPRWQDYIYFFLLALYSVWYFPCSVKMHENYLVKKENRKVCVFQKILWLSYFIGTAQKKKYSNKYSVKLVASQGGHASMKRKGERG